MNDQLYFAQAAWPRLCADATLAIVKQGFTTVLLPAFGGTIPNPAKCGTAKTGDYFTDS
jgi:hypothetical protein